MAKAKAIDTTTLQGKIAAEIRRRREKKKLSVADAAAAAGVPEQTWYRWEQGRSIPLDSLPAIARALGCTLRQLLPAN